MADTAVSVAVEVAKCLVAPVGRHCGYVIYTDRYVRELNGEVEKLDHKRQRVQHSIDEAENNSRQIEADVREWINKEKTVANKAHNVLNDNRSAGKTCFYGWLPSPKARYHLGKEARKTVKDIQELIAWGQFDKVDFENAPTGRVDGAPGVNSSAGDGGAFITDSRASIFQGIMKALNDEKVKVVGVYGPGGVGKSTLLKIVQDKIRIEEKQKKEEGQFHMIVKVEVLRTPDLINVQGQIADTLSLNLKDKETQQGRRDLLFQRLQRNPNEKFLIILDDLWEALDLEAVGIPSGDKSMNCKLLLTSRDKSVLERMNADQTFHLEALKEDEAFRLFEKIVGDKLKDNGDLKETAEKVVRKLAGLPLLITSVATTLKCRNVFTWKSMLRKIEDPNIDRIVNWSYDHLESEEAKCLFLLCGLIGGTIEVELLLGLGMGLGLFRGFDDKMESSRNRLKMMLDSLHSFCLLQDGGDGKEKVTIHDLYSEVVVSDKISGQNSLTIDNNCGLWSKEKLENCWACLVNVGSYRLVEVMRPQFTHVKILTLSDMGDCSRMDFAYMRELRVLYFGSMHITSLPSSMEILGNLRSLSISCHVEDLANLGKLKALQILSFIGSKISKLPKELGKLTNLRSLNLSHCKSLKIIEPGALKGLINLEELHMKESFDQWRGKHELAELKSLTKLAFLEISISNPKILLKVGDLPFEKLEKFWINVGDAEVREHEGLTTMNLNLEGCDSILSRKWIKKNLQKTQCLYLSNLNEFKESPRKLCKQGFREVKYLDIKDSPSIKYIASSSKGLTLTAFGKLEFFFLENLINLEKICHGPSVGECFNKLKAMRVRQCNQLKYLWCLSDVQRLKQLEEIEVSNCDSMQSIVGDIVSTNNRVELPKVRDLGLYELPHMTSFCHTSIQVSLPCLESLTMVGLLGPEEILYSERSLKYSNLRDITIRDSKSTSKSILKLDWILKLPNLESMMIKISPLAEVVFDLEELEVIEDVEILSRLTNLALNELPNLQCVCKQDVKLQGISILRNLRELIIYKTGLSFLFSVSVAKCLGEIRTITVLNCPNMKAVIVDEGRNEGTYDIIEFPLLEYLYITDCSVEKFFSYPCGKREPVATTSDSQDANSDSFFDQKVSLPSLEFLWLRSLGSFKRIWQDELPKSSFCKLATLILENCFELLNVFPLTIIGRLHNIKEVTFPNITRLEISGLQCKELWNNQIPTDSFQKLEYLKLENGDNLQRIGPPQMWKVLQRCLKNLEVILCPLIEIIYEGHGLDTEGGELRRLELQGLKNLRHIWQSDNLPNIPFPNLRDVNAEGCPCLEMLFPTFTAKFLRQIEVLRVGSCEDMELIAGHEKQEEATRTTVTFSKLTTLRLFNLPKFRSFLPEKYSLKFSCSEDFPSLQDLVIESCGAEPTQVRNYLVGQELRMQS